MSDRGPGPRRLLGRGWCDERGPMCHPLPSPLPISPSLSAPSLQDWRVVGEYLKPLGLRPQIIGELR